MSRKMIYVLMALILFIGFILVKVGSARPGPEDRINATAWSESCSRVLPGSQISYENADEAVSNADNAIGQNIHWVPAEKDRNDGGIIKRLNALIPKIKGISGR